MTTPAEIEGLLRAGPCRSSAPSSDATATSAPARTRFRRPYGGGAAVARRWDPGQPGWLTTVASRRWIERWRQDAARRRREQTAATLTPPPPEPVPAADDTLTLLLLCCHPSLTQPSQVALTLRAVGGLTTAEIARAFLVPEATVAQRISRGQAADQGQRSRVPASSRPNGPSGSLPCSRCCTSSSTRATPPARERRCTGPSWPGRRSA